MPDKFDRLRLGPRRLPVLATTLDRAIDLLVASAQRRQGVAVHLVNAYSIVCAHQREDVGVALAAGRMSFSDGMPLVWLARRLGVSCQVTRVYGPDLFSGAVYRGRDAGLRHYLYGGSPDVVARLADALRTRFPGAQIVGVEAPPFRPLTCAEVTAAQERIRSSEAHVVWVGLGTPKQDLLSYEWAQECNAAFVCVGAAFDFLAGAKRQAPRILQRAGLEWLFRLVSEPRRLARRYLVGNLEFLSLVARHAHIERVALDASPVPVPVTHAQPVDQK